MVFLKGSNGFLSNFGIYNNILEGMTIHEGLWEIGSFFKWNKSGKSIIVRKENNI
jgi:hypothetical protein